MVRINLEEVCLKEAGEEVCLNEADTMILATGQWLKP